MGRRLGAKHKLPWNSSKSWAGSGAMFLGGCLHLFLNPNKDSNFKVYLEPPLLYCWDGLEADLRLPQGLDFVSVPGCFSHFCARLTKGCSMFPSGFRRA